MTKYPFERAFYRIRYPLRERPALRLGDVEYAVVDCSESGLRYVLEGAAPPPIGTELTGTLRFRRGLELEVCGTVVRVQADEVAVQLPDGAIPPAVVFDEQRHLRLHYPMWPEHGGPDAAAGDEPEGPSG